MKKTIKLWMISLLGFTNIQAQHSISSLEDVWRYGLENQEENKIRELIKPRIKAAFVSSDGERMEFDIELSNQ